MALSLVTNKLTYEETLRSYLENLTDEQKRSKISGMIVMGTGERGGFYSVVEKMPTLECIGLIEELKYFLITRSLQSD